MLIRLNAIFFKILILNSKKETQSPAPLLIKLGGEKSQLTRNEILKAARELKKSTNFKNV